MLNKQISTLLIPDRAVLYRTVFCVFRSFIMYGDLLQSSGTGKPNSKILTESDRFQANQYAADDEKQPAYYYYMLSQYLNIVVLVSAKNVNRHHKLLNFKIDIT